MTLFRDLEHLLSQENERVEQFKNVDFLVDVQAVFSVTGLDFGR